MHASNTLNIMKNILTLIIACILLSGCFATQPTIEVRYKAIDVPSEYRTLEPIPLPPEPKEFSSIEKDKFTVDLIKQRTMLKDYADSLLEHARVVRLKYKSLLKYIDISKEKIEESKAN